MEKELYDKDSIGKVQIADEVVAAIAGLAATEVKGVAALESGITHEMMNRVSRSRLAKGVKVLVNGKEVKVRLAIMMEYGYNIPATCSKTQDKVKSAIENMTGLTVTDVDIRIASVDMQKGNK